MAGYSAFANLQTALENRCERIYKPRSAVLFRRGEKASGMFVVLRGKVSLDFGVDSAFGRCFGPGALVGLPATLTRQNYSMTATVTEDADLGFWSSQALDTLLRQRPDFCHELLAVLGERLAENQKVAKALLTRDEQPVRNSNVV
ncbi:MAG: Crp/Fnr family transcriptional regulator [Terriglobales bacterium]